MKLNFRLSDINPDANQDQTESLPRAWYKCVIIREESKRNSKNTGSFLQFTLKVIEGDYRGTEVFDTLNIDNPNPVAVKLAGQRLAAYSWVTLGHANESDTMNFQDTQFFAEIGPQKDNEKYSRIYALKDVNGKDPGQQGPAQEAQAETPRIVGIENQKAVWSSGNPQQQVQQAANPTFGNPNGMGMTQTTTSPSNGGSVPNFQSPSQGFSAPSNTQGAFGQQRSSEPPPWATGKK